MINKRLLSRILCLVLIFSMMIPGGVKVRADEDYDRLNLEEIEAYETDRRTGEERPIDLVTSDKSGNIKYKRSHTVASTGVKYSTKHLIMSGSKIDEGSTDITRIIRYEQGHDAEYLKGEPYVMVPLQTNPPDERTVDDEVITTYEFFNATINEAAQALGIKDDDGDGFINIYITHVFQITPSSQSAWDSLKKAVGKVSNTANNKPGNGGGRHDLTASAYDGGKDSLQWYRTMDEFVMPGGDSTFWSNGNANDKMYACMNIRLKVKVNPNVYGAPLTVFLYDYDSPDKAALQIFNGITVRLYQQCIFGIRTLAVADEKGYPYITISGKNYYLWEGEGIAVLQSTRKMEYGGFSASYDMDCKNMLPVSANNYNVALYKDWHVRLRNSSESATGYAVYIPLRTVAPWEEPEPEEPSPTPTEGPSDTNDDTESATVKIVYFDVTKTEADPDFIVKTANAEAAKIGEKYTAKLDIETTSHGDYAVDTVNKDKAYAAYGKTSKVYTQYNKGTKFDASKIEVTADKFKINTKIVSSGGSKTVLGLWVPVKSGPKVTVHYIDPEENEIAKDDGGIAKKGEPYSYRVDTSKVSREYDIKPAESYFKQGATKTPAGVLGDDVRIDPFPFDTAVDLYIPCALKEGPAGTGTYYSWDAMNSRGTAQILSDDFDVETAIPSSEGVYGKITAADTLSRGNLSVFTGTKSYTISVKQWATRSWYIDNGYWPDPVPVYTIPDDPTSPVDHYEQPDYVYNDTPTSDSDWVTSSVTVTLPWTYYTVDDYVLYNLIGATLNNGALDRGEYIKIDSSNTAITASSTHYDEEDDHVKDPAGYTASDMVVTISGTLTASSSGYSAPSWPTITSTSAESAVKTALGPVQVRNDKFEWGTTTVMDDTWVGEDEDHEPDTSVLVAGSLGTYSGGGKTIPGQRTNGQYDSSGQIKYSLGGNFNIEAADSYGVNVPVNPVYVHTPIVCDVTITSDNLKFVQAPSVDTTKTQLVVGRSDSAGVGTSATNNPNMTNDFIVKFSNTGTHRSAKGYGTRDYSKYLYQKDGYSGNALNFPVDLMIDVGNDYDESNDFLLKADEWWLLTTGTRQMRFYLPEWVAEGTYDVEFRSVALNGTVTDHSDEEYANLSPRNRVASAENSIQVTGKIYGFTLYDIGESKEWTDVFRLGTTLKYGSPDKYADGTLADVFDKNKRYYYTAGARNELGILTGRLAKYSVPILSGGNPKFKNLGILKAGYKWNFKFDTVSAAMADPASVIKITPTFYWVDANGENRTKVNLYYTDKIDGKTKSLIKIGGDVDMANVKQGYAADPELGIDKDELKDTARLLGKTYSTWSGTKGNLYAYGGMISNNLFKTFSNQAYAKRMVTKGLNGTKSQDEITKYKQSWYFSYSLPEFHACAATFDLDRYVSDKGSVTYKEPFWYKDGYIIVNFDISCFDKAGNKIMSYSNEVGAASGLCNMFLMESMGRSTGTKDFTDANRTTFRLYGGDVFIVYADPDKMRSSDYGGDHLN